MKIKGKKSAPNGMYWGNVQIKNKVHKVVMIEPIDEIIYLAWSNSSAIIGLPGWNASKKKGWYCKEYLSEEVKVFDWYK